MQPLYDVNHVITCNNNTSTYESHASLSVKMSSVLKNIVFCFTFAAAQCAKSSQTEYPRWKLRIAHDPAEFIERWIFRVLFYVRGIPDICHFFYTGKICWLKILHPKARILRKIAFRDKIA